MTEPTSILARQLAPFQTTLTPWLWMAVGGAVLLAVVFAWRKRPVPAAIGLAAALLCTAIGLDVERDRQVGWEQDSFRRLSSLRADELYYYIPEPSRVRLAACGNDSLAADAMWFRSLFFIYETSDTRGSGDLIYHMYDVMQDLNPAWKEPQLTGPVLVSALSGEDRQLRDNRIELARRLLKKSQAHFPYDFRFHDLEANLYWGAAATVADDQANARNMIAIYGRLLATYTELYQLHPERNPYLDYADLPVRRQIAAATTDWWQTRFPGTEWRADLPDPALTPADRAALATFWTDLRATGDPGVRTALAAADSLWENYRASRVDLRDRLLASLNAPDYRAELLERAHAFCGVLWQELQSPVLGDQERPGKLLDYYRWTDVYRQTGYALQLEAFRERFHRLPTKAEFQRMAWQLQREPGAPETIPPPPAEPPPPQDPFGWAYVYEQNSDGVHVRVRSHFAEVYRTELKASRLLTLIEMTQTQLGRPIENLGEVKSFFAKKYPPGAILPAPMLESFGETHDIESAPCGGSFEWRDGRLHVPADVQVYRAHRKALEQRSFDEIYARTRTYAPFAADDAAAERWGTQPPRPALDGQSNPYP